MLTITQLQPGVAFIYNGKPFIVLDSSHKKLGRGGGIQQVKMRNLEDGSVITNNFKGSETVEEAELNYRKAQFLYRQNDSYSFMDNETFEQYKISAKQLPKNIELIPEGCGVDLLLLNQKALGVNIPLKIEVKIKETSPGIKGGRETAGTKAALTTTGATINVPLFIEAGDRVIINTKTGAYVARAGNEKIKNKSRSQE